MLGVKLTEAEERAVKAAYLMWKSLDFSNMSASRLMGIYDEFENKLQFSAYEKTPQKFLETFARKMGIVNYSNPVLLELVDEEVLKVFREQPRLVVLALRAILDEEKRQKKKLIKLEEEKKKLKEWVQRDIEAFERLLDEYRGGDEE